MSAKEDIVAMLTTSNSYIDVNEGAIECSFQSLEVVNATFVGIGKRVPIPCLSNVIKEEISKLWVREHEMDLDSRRSYKGHSERCR